MAKPTPPFVTPLVGATDLIVADPWQKYFTSLYSEGHWTPRFGGVGGSSGQVYASRAGRFVKKGREVTLAGYLQLSAKGTITGNLLVQGLPFESEQHDAGVPWWVAPAVWSSLAIPVSSTSAILQPGKTEMSLLYTVAGGAASPGFMDGTFLTNSSVLSLSFSYLAQI